jgi:DNA-binding transcriptional ArsR family regulator
MQDVLYIEDVTQAMTLLKPIRLEILRRLDEPRTCPELADYFDETPQKVYYHVKALENARLVDKVAERRVRGVVEGHYQASARAYWLAPQLVSQIGGARCAQDQMSLRVLLDLAEEVHSDIGKLGNRSAVGAEVPSLSLSAHISLLDANRRAEFLNELQELFQELVRKYGVAEEGPMKTNEAGFRLVLMCYPSKT